MTWEKRARNEFHADNDAQIHTERSYPYSESLVQMLIEKEVRGFISFFRETLTGPLLDINWIQARLKQTYQLCLI